MNKPLVITAASAMVFVLSAASLLVLWYSGAALPPVAVRGLGRVAGVMSSTSRVDFELPVALHYQEHSLSCEVAALKMALGFRGLDLPESQLISELPFDHTPKGGGVWGNPHQGFVGDIDGRMLVNGYGVYWDPIANLAARYRRAEVLRGASITDLARHVAAGRPVIIWGYYGRLQPASWRTLAGQTIDATNGEHTRLVVGFSGPASAPTQFALLDPIFGRLVWSADTLLRNWNTLGRHAVVVR